MHSPANKKLEESIYGPINPIHSRAFSWVKEIKDAKHPSGDFVPLQFARREESSSSSPREKIVLFLN